jgi:hypothetical protein
VELTVKVCAAYGPPLDVVVEGLLRDPEGERLVALGLGRRGVGGAVELAGADGAKKFGHLVPYTSAAGWLKGLFGSAWARGTRPWRGGTAGEAGKEVTGVKSAKHRVSRYTTPRCCMGVDAMQ